MNKPTKLMLEVISLLFVVMFIGLIVYPTSAPSVADEVVIEETLSHAQRNAINVVQNLHYVRNRRTNLCYAISRDGYNGYLAVVDCDHVKQLLIGEPL